jgi:hypothetical protein
VGWTVIGCYNGPNFISTELHKATYIALLYRSSTDGAKAFAKERLPLCMGHS